MHEKEADQCESEGKGESVGKALDRHRRFSPSANGAANEAHDEPGDHGTEQQADAVQLRWMHEWMRNEKNAQGAETDAPQCEEQDCQRSVGLTQRCANEGPDTKSATGSGCDGNTFTEGNLDQCFEKKFENEAEEVIHVLVIVSALMKVRGYCGIRSAVCGSLRISERSAGRK